MHRYSLAHVPDPVLLRDLAAVVARDRAITAELLAHLGEVDARKLYLPAAYPSMFAYCVGEQRLSEDAAYKRIQAARAARQFPDIFEALAEGRPHLGAICLLAPYLRPENADGLLAAAAHKTKSEIEELLAQRFPRSEALGLVTALTCSPPRTGESPVPERVEDCGRPASQLAPGQVGTRATLAPVASDRYLIEVTVGRSTHDKLQYVKDLLGHQVPSGDLARVLDRALDALIQKLEQRKLAATTRPRSSRKPTIPGTRHVPAHVRRPSGRGMAAAAPS